MKQLENIDLKSAKSLLHSLRQYSDMSKKLWKRGRNLFMKTLSGEQTLRVEYFPALWESAAWTQAQWVFKKSFGVDADKSSVEFLSSDLLKWGMKVYCDDNMVDLSFKKVEDIMQK